MRSPIRIAAVLVAAGALVAVASSTASADPTGTPTFRPLAGVGSDTTQDVMNGLSNVVLVNGQKAIASYNATGSATVTTKDPASTPGCTINRPNGSGAGRTALLASLGANNGCLDFSRSSSLNTSASSPSLTYVPFAVDAVSYAITASSSVPKTLGLADLKAIYTCDPAYVGTGPNYTIKPILPQSGSGTRSFWETTMGITDTDVNNKVYPCIVNGTKNGQLIEEHTGTVLDDSSLVPFSVAQFTAQTNDVAPDRRGRAQLGVIDGTYAQLLNSNFAVKRDVYNVIPTAKIGTAPWSSVFVGANSAICQNGATITKYGFGLNANCGDTSAKS